MDLTYSIVGAAVGALATGTVKGALKGATVGSAFKIAQDVVGSYRGGVAGLEKQDYVKIAGIQGLGDINWMTYLLAGGFVYLALRNK